MGRKGRRPGAIDTAPTFPEPKQPHDNSRHRELCRLAGKWLRKPKFGSSYCPYVAVELVTASQEIPDVFGWNYWATVLIEVKVKKGNRKDLGRPTTTPIQNKEALMGFLK